MDERLISVVDSVCCFEELYEYGDYLLAIQRTDSDCVGFDYTILSSRDGHEIDGGVYEDEEQDKFAFLDYAAENFLGCHRSDLRMAAFTL